jgi:hypothetical protein
MTAIKPRKPHDGRTCGAKTRKGTSCQARAGHGTDHVGQGKCKLHGGATPIKSGRYSKITRPRLVEILADLDNDGTDPLDLEPELKLLRGLVLDYVERHDALTEALLDWHSSFGPGYAQEVQDWRHKLADWCELLDTKGSFEPPPIPIPRAFEAKPRQMPDILSVGRFIADIGAMVERIHKRRAEGTITLVTLNRVLEQHGFELVAVAEDVIKDAATREKLLDAVDQRWDSIRLDTIQSSSPRHSRSTGPPN